MESKGNIQFERKRHTVCYVINILFPTKIKEQ